MKLRDKATAGLVWSGINQFVTQAVSFVFGAILAHLLSPRDFGLLAMVAVFTGFLKVFSKLGFATALVQRKSINEDHKSSVFWLGLVSGFLMMLIIILSAPFIAEFYNEERLIPITMLVGVTFFIGSFNDVHRALLYRRMDFKHLALIDVTSIVVSGVLAILLALRGLGVWSLVWKTVTVTTIGVIGMWIVETWHPKFVFKLSAIKQLLKYSMNLLGFRTMNYWVRKSDNLLIGKYVGPVGLGIYSKAYKLMVLPLTQVVSVFNRVMFPALSSIQKETIRVKRWYLKSNRMIALCTMPMVTILFVLAKPFILTVYGNQWNEVVPVFQVLCFIAIKQPLGSTKGWIFNSLGKTDIQFKWGILSGVTGIIAFIIGIHWGIMGVAVAYVLRGYALHYLGVVIPGRLINMSFIEYHKNIASVFIISVLTGVIVWGSSIFLPDSLSNPVTILILLPFGAILYWVLIHIFRIRAYRETIEIIKDKITKVKLNRNVKRNAK